MMQGDSYDLGIVLKNNAGQPVTPDDVQDVEITIGTLSKRYKEGKLIYSNGTWLFPLSQDESFSLRPGPKEAQVRVKWANGFVEGRPILGVRIQESMSKEAL